MAGRAPPAVDPQRSGRLDPQRTEDAVTAHERTRRAAEHGPHLGAVTDGYGGQLASSTVTGTRLELLVGFTRPFACRSIILSAASAASGASSLIVGIYRVPRAGVMVGSFTARLAASGAVDMSSTTFAGRQVELDRVVAVTSDRDLWFVGLSADSSKAQDPAVHGASLGAIAGPSFSSTVADMPKSLNYPNDLSRSTVSAAVRALSRTGRRLLWD